MDCPPSERKGIQNFRINYYGTNHCHIPNSFEGSKSSTLLEFNPIASSALGESELLICVHTLTLLCVSPTVPEGFAVLLLSKQCHQAWELPLSVTTTTILLEVKRPDSGTQNTTTTLEKCQGLLTELVVVTCCLSEMATKQSLTENTPRLKNNISCFFQWLKYGLADHEIYSNPDYSCFL